MTLIVFEGGEGVGKTTQIERLYDTLTKQKYEVLKTREPGGTILAEKIRNLLKEKTDRLPQPLTDLYLVSAARSEHIANVLLPAIKANKIVLCDRFLDSTYVYQGLVGGVPKHVVDQVSQPVLSGVLPDLTFVFCCDVRVAQARMKKEVGRTQDRFDSSGSTQHEKLLEGYSKLYRENYAYPDGRVPKRVLVDASQTVDEIFAFVLEHSSAVIIQ